jgi:hypothetical protein
MWSDMDDDSDDILNIDLDEEDDSGASDADVLDIVLEPSGSPPAEPPADSPPRRGPKPKETPQAETEPDGGLPMISGGACPRCGYALRPLEEECPRCAKLGVHSAPLPAASDRQPEGDSELDRPLPQAPRSRGCATAGIIIGVLLLLGAVAVPIAIWMQPQQRAKREYQLGLQAQLRADFETAREHYQKALQLDPDMGLAAFSMGTTFLRVGDPALVQSMQEITERAIQGQTEELDRADEWFRRALQIGERLPEGRRLMDQRIRTPAHLRAFARACLALTAFIRASAALQAEQFEHALAWLQVAHREAQAAVIDDPANSAAQQVLRSVDPLIPPRSDLP